jgi:hypothetical protein
VKRLVNITDVVDKASQLISGQFRLAIHLKLTNQYVDCFDNVLVVLVNCRFVDSVEVWSSYVVPPSESVHGAHHSKLLKSFVLKLVGKSGAFYKSIVMLILSLKIFVDGADFGPDVCIMGLEFFLCNSGHKQVSCVKPSLSGIKSYDETSRF